MKYYLWLTGLSLMVLSSCDTNGKKRDFGQKRTEVFDHIYSAGEGQILKFTYLDSASIRYEIDFVRKDSMNCKGKLAGVAVYMNPQADLESEDDTSGTYPVEEFVHEAENYFLTIRLAYPDKKKASIEAEATNVNVCVPAKKVLIKQTLQ